MTKTAALAAHIAVLLVVLVAAPAAFAGGPVRIAVSGVAGDAGGGELAKLSTELRATVAKRADADVFSVVTSDEMKRGYATRGAACAVDDVTCLASASSSWDGRLFVHGNLKRGDDGVSFTAALDSAKGFHVAHVSIDVDSVASLTRLLPSLVGELFEKERVFRARLAGQTAAPVVMQDDVVPAAPAAPAAPVTRPATTTTATTTTTVTTTATAPAQSEGYVCRDAFGNGLSIGTLTLDDDGITYQSSSGFSQHWHHRWTELKVANPYPAIFQSAILLQANDVFDVRFADSGARDRCVNELKARWYAHR